MTQQLITLTTLGEYLGLVPGTYIVTSQLSVTPILGGLMPSPGSQALHSHGELTYKPAKHTYKIKINKRERE